MTTIVRKPDTLEKLNILSADAQYDLACACGSKKDEHRKRGADGKWIYPITLPNGGKASIFKILLSNVCANDCKYCPLRADTDIRRCTLGAEETVRVFLDYYNQGRVFGIFISSGVIGTPDNTMERINSIGRILRYRHQFKGYMHLKIIPGASKAAIAEAVSLAKAVSLNIETPGADNLAKVSHKKDYLTDIIEPMKYISQLTAKGNRYERVHQTTQFIVGAAGESDQKIVHYMGGLYDRLHMNRVYFSAYQQGLGHSDLPAERTLQNPAEVLTREHRLYQVDFLMRKYGFKDSEILFDSTGRLSLTEDPKETWAKMHPEIFPLDINKADKLELLRVPGLGPTTVNRILKHRQSGRIHRIEDIVKPGKLTSKAKQYLKFQKTS
ncbi:MAG: helix-hairpin-helix domain-containing protein [Planctomycetota bacterium]|jgi:predicted DNA-binding helix-hairpin-helix protein